MALKRLSVFQGNLFAVEVLMHALVQGITVPLSLMHHVFSVTWHVKFSLALMNSAD